MQKYYKMKKIILIFIIGLILGVFSISISTGQFFFTSKYYRNPLEAYNDSATYDAIIGETKAVSQIGIEKLDDSNALFIGKIDDTNFVINEMKIKNEKFASSGLSYFYNMNSEFKNIEKNITETPTGNFEWSIILDESDIIYEDNVSIKYYKFDSTNQIILIRYS